MSRVAIVSARVMLAAALVLGLNATAALADTVMITGASRGIGLEFAKRYAEDGWTVIATARDPAKSDALKALAAKHKNLRLETLDVTAPAQIDALAAKLKGIPIDVLINNAGISGGSKNQEFGKIDYKIFDDVMHTNVLGPVKIAEVFMDNIAASKQKKLVNISSTEGSAAGVSARPGASNIFYRASKSALNMAMINVAKAVKDRGVIVALISPGFVMSDFVGDVRLPIMITVEKSVAMSMPMIAGLTMEQSGKFYRNTGEENSW